MNSKIATKSQLLKTKPKQNKNKNELSKQLEQEQNHRNGDHMESISREVERREWEKSTGNEKHKW